MASFVSPLFWRIDQIVRNGLSSKKEVKSSVAEVERLLDMYGADARLFLIKSLLELWISKGITHTSNTR